MNIIKIKAEDMFLQKRYKDSIKEYSKILKNSPFDEDARIGIILSDMAFEREDEAQALFDYYLILKKKTPDDAAEMVKGIINSFDDSSNKITKALEDTVEVKAMQSDGISYSDFNTLVKNRGSFKEVFENIMFSTKIVILGKDEFVGFLNQLLDNNFDSMALNYLEGAIEIFMYDRDIQKLCDKLRERTVASRG
jgi:tetratricopeptide (TPR) repeat protein